MFRFYFIAIELAYFLDDWIEAAAEDAENENLDSHPAFRSRE